MNFVAEGVASVGVAYLVARYIQVWWGIVGVGLLGGALAGLLANVVVFGGLYLVGAQVNPYLALQRTVAGTLLLAPFLTVGAAFWWRYMRRPA